MAQDQKNPLLPDDRQDSAYVVKGFIIQARVMLLNKDGLEELEVLGPQFGVFQAQFGDTLPQFIEKRGLKMRSNV